MEQCTALSCTQLSDEKHAQILNLRRSESNLRSQVAIANQELEDVRATCDRTVKESVIAHEQIISKLQEQLASSRSQTAEISNLHAASIKMIQHLRSEENRLIQELSELELRNNEQEQAHQQLLKSKDEAFVLVMRHMEDQLAVIFSQLISSSNWYYPC